MNETNETNENIGSPPEPEHNGNKTVNDRNKDKKDKKDKKDGGSEQMEMEMEILTYSVGAYTTNCYIVYDGKSGKACLIDAPVYDDEIMSAISSNGLSLEYIILTHGHFDHILGANAFREKTGAKIAVHELETEYLADPEKSMTFLENGETVTADILLKDNDIITFGGVSLRVIHTPGHTKGSSCFISGDGKTMFSGDTLFKGTIGRYDFYGGDYNILMESLKKLKSMEENYAIYPGHGDDTALDAEIAGNPYFKF